MEMVSSVVSTRPDCNETLNRTAMGEAQLRASRVVPSSLQTIRPQHLCCAARAFGHRLELGPADRGVADPGSEPAICAGKHVFADDQVGVAHQALGHQVGMLDEVGTMADHTWDQGGAFRQLNLLEHPPLVLVTGVRCL